MTDTKTESKLLTQMTQVDAYIVPGIYLASMEGILDQNAKTFLPFSPSPWLSFL